MRLFHILALVTLLADAYVPLALIATRKMKPAYHHYLPPFDRAEIQAIPDLAWLLLVIWTVALAVGCLWPRRGSFGTGSSGHDRQGLM